ncbi:hypothetical protein FOMPIDRAFT_1129217 [Fomitopsis schrenkii]|uniref:DUF6533 domain-containing protein n=1 Tax=Fomitopsis schrenkii TaxID=2126942 RepID=S8F5N8_FOMSC|nr:hypothetical protein FOMPIDRAFT_1129217 [Fomitopsis schrenkii]
MTHKLTLALYACERCSTLDQEVRYIWHYRLSGVSILYMTLQVATVAPSSVTILVSLSPVSCFSTSQVYIITAAISSLRVYALNPQDRVTPVVVLILSLGPAVYQTVSKSVFDDEFDKTPCPSSTLMHHPALLVPTVATTIADVIVLLVTWHITYHTNKLSRVAGVPAPLTTLLLRDGT